MLLVLGCPGSGCSTFLKAMAVETEWFEISSDPYQQMRKHFKGAGTLAFAASMRSHDNSLIHDGLARTVAGQFHLGDFHLGDSLDTRVGNAMIRGLSVGEKRRTSTAEIFVGGTPFQFWDNCTRGLDKGDAEYQQGRGFSPEHARRISGSLRAGRGRLCRQPQ
ncbi:hypothetical protein F5883DRAFT_721709 [Diaporthe sp. PMI_573]|nr:hypothetical protein F5883DRAFT_721709 [Diaporthaceae sp. PMI_573]